MFRKQNLILTYASGEALFSDPTFWVFVESYRKNTVDADLIILTHDIPEEARNRLFSKEVEVIDVSAKDIHFLYRDRHLSFYNYLNEHGHKYKYVLVSDCRDVLFQKNPFDWIEEVKFRLKNIKGSQSMFDHFVTMMAEGFRMSKSGFACIEHFEFQRDIPAPYLKEDKDRWVVNGGVFMGTPTAMQNWHFLIWMTTLKTIGRCTDQATVNWLMHYLEDENTYQTSFPQHDHLCLTGEGVKEGAVEPIAENGILKNPLGNTYYLVHQWDRLIDVKESVLAKYSN